MTDGSLEALLLTNRIVDVGATPLTASEFWTLARSVGNLSSLAGRSSADLIAELEVSTEEAERYAALLAAGTAFAFERERLTEEGVRLISAVDEAFPGRLRERLGSACPSFLLVAGPMEPLEQPGIGLVGAGQAPDVVAAVAELAAANDGVIVTGLERGVALDTTAVGVPAEGIRIAARDPKVRRGVHAGQLCLVSPYAPSARASAASAAGRIRLIEGLVDVTLVVDAVDATRAAIARSTGPVGVWTGPGAGPGNATLIAQGGVAVSDVRQLLDSDRFEIGQQFSLFE